MQRHVDVQPSSNQAPSDVSAKACTSTRNTSHHTRTDPPHERHCSPGRCHHPRWRGTRSLFQHQPQWQADCRGRAQRQLPPVQRGISHCRGQQHLQRRRYARGAGWHEDRLRRRADRQWPQGRSHQLGIARNVHFPPRPHRQSRRWPGYPIVSTISSFD